MLLECLHVYDSVGGTSEAYGSYSVHVCVCVCVCVCARMHVCVCVCHSRNLFTSIPLCPL